MKARLADSQEFRNCLNQAIEPTALAALHTKSDPLVLHYLDLGLRQIQADEGTLWLINQEESHLVPVYNSGPNAESILERHRQPLDEGLIGMVFVNGQSMVENDTHLNENQSKRLDRMLGLRTRSLIAVPYHLFGKRLGVASFVQLDDPGAKQPLEGRSFNPNHLEEAENLISLIARLTEHAVLGDILGMIP